MSTSDTLGKNVRWLQECNSTYFVVDVIVIVFTFLPITVVYENKKTEITRLYCITTVEQDFVLTNATCHLEIRASS